MFKIVKREQFSPVTYLWKLEAPDIAKAAQPGHFVIVRHGDGGERVPLTIADFDKEKGTLTFIFQEVGFSTKKLGSMKPGDSVAAVLGPLGKATHVEKFGTVFCIGGGVGIAEMFPVALAYKKAGNRIIGIIGARTKELLILEVQLRSVCDELLIATDDGSVGVKGFVTDILSARLEKDMPCLVYAVGPVLMMEKVAAMTRPNKIKTIVSLNPIMVDATGMCGVCRVSVGGKTRFACVDGPEFDAHQINWDELSARLSLFKTEEKSALDKYKCDSCKSK